MKLSKYLVEKGISQAVFGAKIGMSQSSVWRMTKGWQFTRREIRNRILDETNGEVDIWEDEAGGHPPPARPLPSAPAQTSVKPMNGDGRTQQRSPGPAE